MGILFNAGEIFEIAIQIERNGARFYRNAAANTNDEGARHELLELAAMEDSHEITFTEMKRDLVGQDDQSDWYDPENEAALYLQSFAQGQVFDMTKDPSELLDSSTTLRQVLEWAIQRERDSVVFFLGLKDLVPASLGANKIEQIIKQEMAHIALLNRRLLRIA